MSVFIWSLCVFFCGLACLLWRFADYKRYRLFLGFCVRITRYEFWPTSLFYLPVVIYYLLLCVPRRRLDLLAWVNPGLPDPFRTPKTAILDPLIKKHPSAVAGFVRLPRQEFSHWKPRIANFQKDHPAYPLVIKPEEGERGKNVFILHNPQELKEFLSHFSPQQDYLAQEFVAGTEYGVHYICFPNEKKGRICSLIRKKKIALIGDGDNTLRTLILRHPRAFIMARTHFDFHKDQLDRVPSKGEKIPLVTIGAHSLGTVFENAHNLIGPRLEKRIDAISKAHPGFYVGRYDVIAENDAALKNGAKLKILELNGVMGEPGHLYHPNTPLLRAYGILISYCRTVVAIAVANIRAGRKPVARDSFLASVRSALWG